MLDFALWASVHECDGLIIIIKDEIADIWTACDFLREFKERMQNTGAVLEAELEDDMVNAEDFKKIEREDDRVRCKPRHDRSRVPVLDSCYVSAKEIRAERSDGCRRAT